MRTHSQIVKEHGATNMVRSLAGVGVDVHQSTPQRWVDRNSIPAEHWRTLADLGIATLDELADAASRRPEDQGAAA